MRLLSGDPTKGAAKRPTPLFRSDGLFVVNQDLGTHSKTLLKTDTSVAINPSREPFSKMVGGREPPPNLLSTTGSGFKSHSHRQTRIVRRGARAGVGSAPDRPSQRIGAWAQGRDRKASRQEEGPAKKRQGFLGFAFAHLQYLG